MRTVITSAVAVILAFGLIGGVAQGAEGASRHTASGALDASTSSSASVRSAVSAPVTAFITALYNDFLSRNPSSDDITWWGHRLESGSQRGAVAAGFVNSDEYRLIRIDAAYRSILGRDAEPAGRASWLNGMQTGLLTTDDIERSLYASDEFYNDNGGTDLSWVNGLYQHILGRDASNEEQWFWITQGTQYGLAHFDWMHQTPGVNYQIPFPRVWVIASILNSTEGARGRVSLMYQHYLGRVPDDGGLTGWANYDLAVGDSATRSGITGSDEYFGLASQRF